MDNYMPMGTTKRHNNIITSLLIKLGNLIEKKEVTVLHEECPLVFFGTRKEPMGMKLVDVNKMKEDSKDIDEFLDSVIELLESVQPDFMLFQDNPYLENKYDTRTAGQPDLIIEIWSKSNTAEDRKIKKNLYSTSDITEHWYIEQDSNKVECYFGNEQLPDQYLTNVLITKKGIEFDLRYLAIQD
jgi:hypothetical protein